MPQICVLCKKEPFPGDITRSFHRFPKNCEQRQKWMTATGVQEVKKVHAVCSDHFGDGSYHQTDGYTRLRRLLPTAVPEKNVSYIRTCTISPSNNNVCNDSPTTTNTQNIMILVPRSEQERANKICLINIDSRKTPSDTNNCIYLSSDLLPQPKVTETTASYNMNQDAIRKLLIPEKNTLSRQRFRFLDRRVPCYLSRQDVTTDESWARIIKLMKLKKKQLACAKKRNWRRGKEISSFKELGKSLEIKNKIETDKSIGCS